MSTFSRQTTVLLVIATASFIPGTALGQGAGPITFTKDVAPILQEKCLTCHRPGEMAPMPLRTYQEVRPWARSIKNKVSRREMPPWFIDETIGIQKYKNDASLSDAEIETIVRWVDGAPLKAMRGTCPRRGHLPTARDGESARRISSSPRKSLSRCTRRGLTGGPRSPSRAA